MDGAVNYFGQVKMKPRLFTPKDVLSIRASHLPTNVLAYRYGCSPTTISDVRNEASYRWVENENSQPPKYGLGSGLKYACDMIDAKYEFLGSPDKAFMQGLKTLKAKGVKVRRIVRYEYDLD